MSLMTTIATKRSNARIRVTDVFNLIPVPNYCASSPCLHGTCHNQGTSYQCHCNTGYSGTNCDIGITVIILEILGRKARADSANPCETAPN